MHTFVVYVQGRTWRRGGGGVRGAVARVRKTKFIFFFSNMVFEFAGLFLVAILGPH